MAAEAWTRLEEPYPSSQEMIRTVCKHPIRNFLQPALLARDTEIRASPGSGDPLPSQSRG
jgi:hypothetical protein